MWLSSSCLSPRPAVMWPALTRLVSAGAGVTRVNKRRTETPCRELLCVVSLTRQSDAGQTVIWGGGERKVMCEVYDLFFSTRQGRAVGLSKLPWLSVIVRRDWWCHVSV